MNNLHLIGMKYPKICSTRHDMQCKVISVNDKEATIRNTRGKIYRIPVHIAQVIWKGQQELKESREKRRRLLTIKAAIAQQ